MGLRLGLHYLVTNHGLGLLSLFRCNKIYTIRRPTGTGPWVGRSASGVETLLSHSVHTSTICIIELCWGVSLHNV